MPNQKITPNNTKQKRTTLPNRRQAKVTLAALGMIGLVSGCNTAISLSSSADAQMKSPPTPAKTPSTSPTSTPSSLPPTATPTITPAPTSTPWPTFTPSPTPWPTSTAWPSPEAWKPVPGVLPTLTPVPIVANTFADLGDLVPVNYSPPDGVDVFGNTYLRWEYLGQLAQDEFFDIKIKPLGSENSAFVDWTKSKAYELRPWQGWTPGLYTWQIGIVKGYLEGETKHFITDTGRDSGKFIIKWQQVGHGGGGGGGGSNGGGGGGSGGS